MTTAFRKIALLQSHAAIPVWHDYYVPDLVELCALAASVREEVEEVAIPVAPTDRDPHATFERFLRRNRPDLVGISTFTCGARSALVYAGMARRHGATVVLGGYHPTALPEEALACPDVDVVVRGEGEVTFAELLRTGSPHGVAGLSYRADGRVVHNPARAPIPDLDALPLPWRAIRPERAGLTGCDYHTDTIYASRGCRGRCVFCANHLIGGPWRSRSVDGILRELMSIPLPGRGRRKRLKFWDSSFLTEPERVERLANEILAHGLEKHYRFIAESRAEDIVRAADLLPLLQRASFARIGCGVESPNRRTHATLRKGLNLDHVERAAALLERAGIQFSKFLIVGHDGETDDDVLAYPAYALSHGVRLQNTTFFVMTPYPGTELAARYEAEGRVASHDWDLYTNLGAVVVPTGMTAARLQQLHAAVALTYKCARRFLAGRPAAEVVVAGLEPLLLLASVELQRLPGRSAAEVAACVHAALVAACGTTRRPARPHRRLADRLAVRFHLPGAQPVAVGVDRQGADDVLVVRCGPERLSPHGVEVHVDLVRLVAFIRRVDHRRLAADVMTLRRRPRAFRLRWLPSFARNVAVAVTFVVGLAFSQAVAVWARPRTPAQARDPS